MIDDIKTTQINVKGKKIFQPNLINWSYLYLGKAALTHINRNSINNTFNTNQSNGGMKVRASMLNGGSHPPKNNITAIALIKIMLAYSPKKNRANAIDEYSTL